MAIISLNPYLNLKGNATQAIAFYERTLGAKKGQVMGFDQVPGMPVSDATKGLIMHAELAIGGGVFMISDAMPDQPLTPGSNVQVVLHFDDVPDLNAKFNALSEGGKVTHPVHDAFFGAKFGMLTDKFGVDWMLICQNVK